MELIKATFVSCLILYLLETVTSQSLPKIKPELIEKSNELCQNLQKNPYFEIEEVIGKPWRIYYTWNMKLDNKCMDLTFKNATPKIVSRIWNDMNEYLDVQPNWNAATLHLTMGKVRHEMLLFADQGPAGSFIGVPNIARDGSVTISHNTVPLLKFQFKLVHGSKFLVMSDCHMGVSSLSARTEEPPYRSELDTAAAKLKLGDGYHACLGDKNKDELVPLT